MEKKLSLMTKVELYYRTRSPYHIIDTRVFPEVYEFEEVILFTREHENFVIWETNIYDGYEGEVFYWRGEILNYEKFIHKFKDYYFEYFNEGRIYRNYLHGAPRNSVFPENLSCNK